MYLYEDQKIFSFSVNKLNLNVNVNTYFNVNPGFDIVLSFFLF